MKYHKNKTHIYLTIILGIVSVLVNCFISLFITPKITNSIGIEAYGYVTLAKNLVAYATILTTALNSYATRYISIAYLKGEMKQFNRYMSTVFYGDLFIGLALLVVGILFTLRAEFIINIESKLVNDVKILFLLSFIYFFVNTISTVFTASSYIKNKVEILSIIKTVSYVVETIVLFFCFWVIEPETWYVGMASLSMALVFFIGTYRMTRVLLPESRLSIKNYNTLAFKELVINGFWNSANSLGNALNSGLDLLITNLLLSNVAMGQVSVAKTINNVIYALYLAISQAFQPKLLKHYSNGNKNGLIRELKYAMSVSGIITNSIFAGFLVIGYDFLNMWLPGQDIKIIYLITVITMMPCISEGCVFPLYYVYTLTVKNKIPCIITIIGGLLNVLCMIVLIRYTSFGIYSIVVTTAVIMNFIGFVTNPIYISNCLQVKKFTFYPEILLNVLFLAMTIVALSLVKSLWIGSIHEWKCMIISVFSLGGLAVVIQILFFRLFNCSKDYVRNCYIPDRNER